MTDIDWEMISLRATEGFEEPQGRVLLGSLIIKELSESNVRTQLYFADKYHIAYESENDVLQGLKDYLSDPNVNTDAIIKLANEALTNFQVEYIGDNIVSLTPLTDDDYGFKI